jgi:hypothetical protein
MRTLTVIQNNQHCADSNGKCKSSITSTIDLAYSLDGGVSWFDIANHVKVYLLRITIMSGSLPDWHPGTAIQVRICVMPMTALTTEVMKLDPFTSANTIGKKSIPIVPGCHAMEQDYLVFQDKMWLLGGWNPFLEDRGLPGYTYQRSLAQRGRSAIGTYVGDAPWQGKTHGRMVGA